MPSSISNSEIGWRKLTKIGVDLALLVAVVIGFQATLFGLLPRDPESYMNGFALKRALLEETPAPRLIIVGGSSAAFGVDCPTLTAALDVRAINASLHIGLGVPFMLNVIEADLRAGDTVVLMPEYQLLFDDLWRGGQSMGQLLFEQRSAVRFLSAVNLPRVAVSVPRAIQDRLQTVFFTGGGVRYEDNPVYHHRAFNSCGDVVSHLGRAGAAEGAPLILRGDDLVYQPALVSRLDAFFRRCAARGVTVRLVPPSVRRRDCRAGGQELVQAWERLRADLPTGMVLGEPAGFAFDGQTCFFDTAYHLNAKGTGLRMARLLEVLGPSVER